MNTVDFSEKLQASFPFLNKIKVDMLKIFMDTIKVGKYPVGTMILEEGASC